MTTNSTTIVIPDASAYLAESSPDRVDGHPTRRHDQPGARAQKAKAFDQNYLGILIGV